MAYKQYNMTLRQAVLIELAGCSLEIEFLHPLVQETLGRGLLVKHLHRLLVARKEFVLDRDGCWAIAEEIEGTLTDAT